MGVLDGNLKFELHGHMLQGRWVLGRMKITGKKQPTWPLIKERDAYAQDGAADGHRSAADQDLPAGAVPSALPHTLAPQMATLVAGPPQDAAKWLFEIKFDGYRMLVRNDAASARLLTRNGYYWTAKLQPLHSAFESLKLPPGWYDGEIVVPKKAGIPDFGELQQAFDTLRTDDAILYLFDVPYAAGHDMRDAPLHARRWFQKGLLAAAGSDQVRFSEPDSPGRAGARDAMSVRKRTDHPGAWLYDLHCARPRPSNWRRSLMPSTSTIEREKCPIPG